jgi:hypothetical protein
VRPGIAAEGLPSAPEAVVTGWHLLSGKEYKEGAMKIHRDRRSDAAGRRMTARRFAVGRRGRLAASAGSAGLPGPAFTDLLASRPLLPITATSGAEGRP